MVDFQRFTWYTETLLSAGGPFPPISHGGFSLSQAEPARKSNGLHFDNLPVRIKIETDRWLCDLTKKSGTGVGRGPGQGTQPAQNTENEV